MRHSKLRHRLPLSSGRPAVATRLPVILLLAVVLLSKMAGADGHPPTLIFQSPAQDAVVGGIEGFNTQVSDQDGLAASNPVRWGLDGAPISASATVNPNYSCGENCAMYEFDIDTTPLLEGAHTVSVEVADDIGNVGVFTRTFVVANSGIQAAGNGLLLRRTHGSQTCIDCHKWIAHKLPKGYEDDDD